VKRPKTYQSPEQKEFQKRAESAGAYYAVVRSIENVQALGLCFPYFATSPAQYSACGDWIHHPVSPNVGTAIRASTKGRQTDLGSLIQSYGKFGC
jgi:hypothetical protein